MYSKEQIERQVDAFQYTSSIREQHVSLEMIARQINAIAMMLFNRMYGDEPYCVHCGKTLDEQRDRDNDICEQCQIQIGDKRRKQE